MPSEEDQATVTGNNYKNLVKFGRVISEIYKQTHRQTDRQTDQTNTHTHHNTSDSSWRRSNDFTPVSVIKGNTWTVTKRITTVYTMLSNSIVQQKKHTGVLLPSGAAT